MNDFTKEELESISNWGEVYTEFGSSWSDKSERPLINKIQSMIHNYCEHEWFILLADSTNNPFIKKCNKCDALRFCDE